jgi:zinc protease
MILLTTKNNHFNLDSPVGRVLWYILSIFWQGTTTRQTTFCKEGKRHQGTERIAHNTCGALTKWLNFLRLKITTFSKRYQSHQHSSAESWFNSAFLFKFASQFIIFSFLITFLPLSSYANTQSFTLANGLKLIVKEDHRAPTAVQMVWYKAGSMDEHNGTTGLAHALEHMMFKGTKNIASGEFSAKIAALGGRENAFTSKDYTAYFQQIDRSKLEAVMALEADRMHNLNLNEEEFSKEIKVIMEERRLRTDNQTSGQIFETLYANAFTAHPYRHPIIGWMNDLENMSIQDVQQWYNTWYAPNNAILIIGGNVNTQEVLNWAKKYYEIIPAKQVPTTKPQKEPVQKGIRRINLKAVAQNPQLVLAYQAPSLPYSTKQEDADALEILAAVLNGYDNARFNARLIRNKKIATDINTDYSHIGRGPGLFIIAATPTEKTSLTELEKQLKSEVKTISEQGISETELARIKTQLIAQQIYKRDSLFGQIMEIGLLESFGLDYTQSDTILKRLQNVTKEQVRSVAKQYFNDDTLTVLTLTPIPLQK